MSGLFHALERHLFGGSQRTAIADRHRVLTYGQLMAEVDRLAARLSATGTRAIGLLADNGAAWAVADLAAFAHQLPLVPIPAFFTPQQVSHVVSTAGIDLVLTDQAARVAPLLGVDAGDAEPLLDRLEMLRLRRRSGVSLPPGTCKITFTSGTTGRPKGVCLTASQLVSVARALRDASDADPADRHLCLLPLPTLLENIAGVYVPLLAGATTCVPALADVGLDGSSGFDVVQAISALSAWRATTALSVPETLGAMVGAARAGIAMPCDLRYLAVGGGSISPQALAAALACGLPVYEGYGLSECGSVVAVNRPGANRVGSVGKPLPHVQVRIAPDGEILVDGAAGNGYLGESPPSVRAESVATGDLGYLDDEGYLHVTGRKRDVFVTSFGRNVAPDWVERELVAHPQILQALVDGEARPFNSAILVIAPDATTASIDDALASVNRSFPDYAQVRAWIPAMEPFSPRNGLLTFNGRLRRDHILTTYAKKLDALYRPASEPFGRSVPRETGERHA